MSQSSVEHPIRSPALQADLIVNRTAHILHKRGQAAHILLSHAPSQTLTDTVDLAEPTLRDLAEQRSHWVFLVPDDTASQRELAAILAARYGVTEEAIHSLIEGAGKPPEGSSGLRIDDPSTADVMAALEWIYLRRGEVLYEQGAEADHLYVIVDGLIALISADEAGNTSTQMDLRSGDLTGALPLLTHDPYLATARAARDSDICRLPRAAFERLVQKHPALMTRLAVRMATFLRDGSASKQALKRAVVTVVLPATGGVDDFVNLLISNLKEHGATLHMDSATMQAELQRRVGADLEDFVDEYGFVDWLRQQAARHTAVVYVADADHPNWTRRCIEQADRILIAARADESPAISAVEGVVDALPDADLLARRELVLLHTNGSTRPTNTRAWLETRNVTRHHHVALDSGAGVDRVSRFLRGKGIALVIGGGGMRSVAGLGAVRVLEEHGIVADVVGGTSGGAIAAALYAMGLSSDEAARVTREKLMKRNVLVQPTLPFVSVTSGQNLAAAYQEVFGDLYMEDLWISPFTISGNLTQAKMMIHSHGLLRHGVRASTSLAGIMPPALTEEGDLLIDGGIFDNTPADVARDMVETGPVIAVDLGFTVRQRIPYDYGESLSGWKVLRRRLNPFKDKIQTPSIVGIMMRANALGSINATLEQVTYADLLLQPPVSDYGLFDFDAFDTIVDQGYEYSKPILEAWLDAGGLDAS